jgi:hypothetical protein
MGSRIVNDHRSGSWQFAARELVLDGALTMLSLSTEPLFTISAWKNLGQRTISIGGRLKGGFSLNRRECGFITLPEGANQRRTTGGL